MARAARSGRLPSRAALGVNVGTWHGLAALRGLAQQGRAACSRESLHILRSRGTTRARTGVCSRLRVRRETREMPGTHFTCRIKPLGLECGRTLAYHVAVHRSFTSTWDT
eukprot:5340640-Prymnesium_polylepis.2